MENVLNIFSLKGKTAIVTGGSGNYGKQITEALASAGARVIIASRNKGKNQEYANELIKKGYNVITEELDQGNEESINNFAKRVSEKYKIDVLVNNAVLRCVKSFDDDAENFSKSLIVNGTGAFILHRVFGDIMAKQGGGSIINIGSYMGELGPDDTLYKDVSFSGFSSPDYFFHKAGLTNLTRFMASKYGPFGVRCNVLQLGGLFNNQDERFVNRYNERTFLKRMANNTDIMGIIIYLASDASLYMTGATIALDGGYTAK